MIFVTVGTQLPFPRLVSAMDVLAGEIGEEVVAQIGPFEGEIRNMEAEEYLAPDMFFQHFKAARAVVSHAGIGSILSAQRFGKPLIIIPRRYELGEHRNDHQLATARQMEAVPGLYVAWNESELGGFLTRDDLEGAGATMSPARQRLIQRIESFIAA